jgi:hypothetical protein
MTSPWVALISGIVGVVVGQALSHFFGWRTQRANIQAKERTDWLIEFRATALSFIETSGSAVAVMISGERSKTRPQLTRHVSALGLLLDVDKTLHNQCLSAAGELSSVLAEHSVGNEDEWTTLVARKTGTFVSKCKEVIDTERTNLNKILRHPWEDF